MKAQNYVLIVIWMEKKIMQSSSTEW
jgi:hypothetical protein